MDYTRLLDQFPLWGVLVATLVVVLLSIEGGYRLGQYRRARLEPEKDAPVGAIVAATLSLLAFMLAFTFGMAASRFRSPAGWSSSRNRMRLGPPTSARESCPNLIGREFASCFENTWTCGYRPQSPARFDEAIAKSSELHAAFWSQTSEVAAQDNRSILTGIFVQSLNEVIDLHAKRILFALHNRIPELVWFVLYFMAVISMTALGYQEGLSGSRRSLAVLALALTFSAVIWLIADLDRPQEGLLRVSHARCSICVSRSRPRAPRPAPASHEAVSRIRSIHTGNPHLSARKALLRASTSPFFRKRPPASSCLFSQEDGAVHAQVVTFDPVTN